MSFQPLISCIMPTANRRVFVPRAIAYFERRDYTNRELIVVDDGDDAVDDVIPADERIRHIRLSIKMTVDARRNLVCEEARGGIITHWDEDDEHAPHRRRYQVEGLLRRGADVCATTMLLFYDPNTGRVWRYIYPAGQHGRFVLGLNNQRRGMNGRAKTYMMNRRTFEALACGKPFLAAHSEAYERLGFYHGEHMAWVERPSQHCAREGSPLGECSGISTDVSNR